MNRIFNLLIIIYFVNCSGETDKYEYIEKNDIFRNTINTGHFIQLSKGFTYYEYEKVNNDDLIVFIHGFSVPSYIWDETYYEAIRRGYGVLRLDLFGRGFSDNPEVAYTDELFSYQVVELLDKLNVTKKINLVGLSNGGRVISKIAEKHSNRIKRLIYVSPSGFHNSSLKPDTSIVTKNDVLSFINNNYKTIANGQLNDFKYPSRFKDWDKKYEELLKYKGFARALISTKNNHYSLDLINKKIGEMLLPQYAIWGNDDAVLPLIEVRNKISTLMPNLILYVIDDSGHLPHKEKFDEFNNIFFNQILR